MVSEILKTRNIRMRFRFIKLIKETKNKIRKEKEKKLKKRREKMKLICKYLTNGSRCSLSSRNRETGLYEKCGFLNGPYPNHADVKELKKRKEFLDKAALICKDLYSCKCKKNDRDQFQKIAMAVQKEMEEINKKIDNLEKKKKRQDKKEKILSL